MKDLEKALSSLWTNSITIRKFVQLSFDLSELGNLKI